MIRMLIIGYLFAIRSERALCRDVQVNLAYRWFCGLSIEDKIISTPARSRRAQPRGSQPTPDCRPVERSRSPGMAAPVLLVRWPRPSLRHPLDSPLLPLNTLSAGFFLFCAL